MQILDLDNLGANDNELFNRTAREIRPAFDTFVAEVSRPHVQNIDWIVGAVASRNKFQSPLFLRCCRLAFLDRKLPGVHEAVEVRVADRALANVVRRAWITRRTNVQVRCTESVPQRIRRITRPLRQAAISAATFAMRYVARRSPQPVDRPLVLLDTFVIKSNGGESGSIVGGVYKDRYYPGLLGLLSPEEREAVRFLPSILGFANPIEAFRQIRSSSTPFLIHDDYLRLRDYLFALGAPLRIMRLRLPAVSFKGYDVAPLLREDRRRHCADLNSLQALLYYRFARRLAESGVRVQVLVEWYENQSIDRGMIVGFHRYHPGTRIVGYQGFIVATDLHIYIRPTRTESLGGAVPDVVMVTGHELENGVREFLADVPVATAPGFRFQKVWRDRQHFPDPATFTVLVSLPIEREDAAHILRLLTSDPEIVQDTTLTVNVKPHPTSSPDQIRALLPAGRFPKQWRFVGGDFHDALERSNVMIGNASSTCLESLAKGVPVIVIAPPSGIVQNVIPSSVNNALWAVCATASQIKAALDRFRRSGPDAQPERERCGRAVRESYFAPVTREGVVHFLGLNGPS